jgi:hypothetical protein
MLTGTSGGGRWRNLASSAALAAEHLQGAQRSDGAQVRPKRLGTPDKP